jgi:hypothetical protein
VQLTATITAHRVLEAKDDVPAADEYDVLFVHVDHENASGVEPANYPRTVQVPTGDDPSLTIRALAAELRALIDQAPHPLVGSQVNLDG